MQPEHKEIDTPWYEEFVEPARQLLEQMGGPAGLFREENSKVFLDDSEDAFLVSTQNEVE